ncbi:hypothetical protein V496_07703, partial [Pseudogymnoascus sp. VKM F-4515 (FW-2607)]
MRKIKWLLGSQKRTPDPTVPDATNSTQPITPISQSPPADNPPSYEQAQFNRPQNEFKSRPNSSPSPMQTSNPARYTTEEAPNYASSQATQTQHHQADKKQNYPLAEDADGIALLLENGWDTASWAPHRNHAERNNALYWAATNGHVSAARHLMRNGASGMPNGVGLNEPAHRIAELSTGKCGRGEPCRDRVSAPDASHGGESGEGLGVEG